MPTPVRISAIDDHDPKRTERRNLNLVLNHNNELCGMPHGYMGPACCVNLVYFDEDDQEWHLSRTATTTLFKQELVDLHYLGKAEVGGHIGGTVRVFHMDF